MILQDISIFAAAVAAVAAMAAAIASFMQISMSAKANRASVFLQFSDRYDKTKVTEAIGVLLDWKKNTSEDFVESWAAQFRAGTEAARKVNIARRSLNRYFDDIVRAYEVGLLDKRLANALADRFGLLIYYDIVAPMNQALLGDKYLDRSLTLRKIGASYNGDVVLEATT